MKHSFSLALFLYLLPAYGCAQEEYRPFVVEGKVWNMLYDNNPNATSMIEYAGHPYTYSIQGDTIIEDTGYKRLYRWDSYYAALREEAHKVYMVKRGENKEELLYDFDFKTMENDEYLFKLENLQSFYADILGYSRHVIRAYISPLQNISENSQGVICLAEGIGIEDDVFDPENWIKRKRREVIYTVYEGDECIYSRALGTVLWSYRPSGVSMHSALSTHTPPYFDLQGRRLTREPAHGIFIKDGKKVMR